MDASRSPLRGLTGATARWRSQRICVWFLLLILLLGWVLRWSAWSDPSLHPDEALYAYWARLIASGRDPFLLSVYVDKPPLHLYLVALAFKVWGVAHWTARLPSLFAGFLTLSAFYATLRPIYGVRPAAWAMAFLALSPYAIAFAPSVFTDSLLLACGWIACAFAVRGRWLRAGIALAFACAAKQQGILFVPCALALAWVTRGGHRANPMAWRWAGGRLLLGFSLPFAFVLWWDSLRWQHHPGFLERSWQVYGGIRLAPLDTWPARATEWSGWLRYLTASPWLSLLLLVSIALLAAGWLHRRDLPSRVDGLIIAFSVIYLLLHWWFTFSVWDRYVLLLAPWIALLLARGSLRLREVLLRRRSWSGPLAGALLLVMAWPPAWQAAHRRLPLAVDAVAYADVPEAATWIAQHLPEEAVLYYHELGWHLHYELFDGGPAIRWFEDGTALANDLARRHGAAYLILPDWSPLVGEVDETLAARGRALTPHFEKGVIGVYAIVPEVGL